MGPRANRLPRSRRTATARPQVPGALRRPKPLQVSLGATRCKAQQPTDRRVAGGVTNEK